MNPFFHQRRALIKRLGVAFLAACALPAFLRSKKHLQSQSVDQLPIKVQKESRCVVRCS